MPLMKCTFTFEQGPYGWSESYYRNPGSDSLAATMVAARALALKRIKLSGLQTKLSYVKVSNELVARDNLLFSYGQIDGTLPTGTSTHNSDSRFAALICKRQNVTNTATSLLLLRGIWDDLVTAEGFLSLNADWVAVWSAFMAEYVGTVPGSGNGWGFNAKDVPGSSRPLILNLTQALTGQIIITTTAPLPGAPAVGTKKRVYVSGVLGCPSVNGQQVVVVAGASSVQTQNRIPILPYLGGGSMTWNANGFQEITQVATIRTCERKTGRPLYLSRGRSRVRKLA